MKQKNKQVDYTAYGTGYQVCLPINSEIKIPKDDPVRLLSALVERMDKKALYATYCENGRNEYSPDCLLKICIYGYMRKIISSRGIETACRENINFMYLLEGRNPPDHNTISRFRSEHLAACKDQILFNMVKVLQEMNEISFDLSAVFIDGTKIESVGNRYQFVWKKSVEKNLQKMRITILETLPGLLEKAGISFYINQDIRVHHLKKLRRKLYARMKEEQIETVYGKGKRKTAVQRVLEQVEEWIQRYKKYLNQIHICGGRNSYCKTDQEATFMRMKEDHMLNGQLKPAYNINAAICSEYVIGTYVSSDRTDTQTTIPFMKQLNRDYPIKRVVYDSGYESEENYKYFEENSNLDLYVKPANHEQNKQKKYSSDISRRENMQYNSEEDTYTCANGKKLTFSSTRQQKSASGFKSEKSIYECHDCSGCSLKGKCIRSKSSKPLEERFKRIEVSKYFARKRQEMEEKICTDEGKMLRMNRSIQAEGVFAYTKTDLQFKRFMTHGATRVGAEWTLLAMAYNVLKMHHKSQNGRLGSHLFSMAVD